MGSGPLKPSSKVYENIPKSMKSRAANVSHRLALDIVILICLFGVPERALATGGELTRGHAVRPSQCDALGQSNWTNQEKWVWKELCAGREADFNTKEDKVLSPNVQNDWPETRVVSPKFLNLIVLREPYVSALTHRGVRINGAWFKEPVDLSDAVLGKPLGLKNCRFDADVDLSRAQSSHWISLGGSGFYGLAIMPRLQVAGSLRLNRGAFFRKDVVLSGAIIGDVLSLDNVRVSGLLDMNSMRVETNVFMDKDSEFQDVALNDAKIGTDLVMTGSSFEGLLSMKGLLNRGSVWMSDGSSFAGIDLAGAKINGRLLINNASFTDRLNMEGLQVGGALLLRNARFTIATPIELPFSKIDSNLDVSGSVLPSLNLTGTIVKGEFRLGSGNHPPVQWKKGAKLTLRNTQVEVLQDRTDAWPEHLELDGFTYVRLGGMGSSDGDDPMQRDTSWFKSFLAKQQPFSPQPYQHLSSVFRASGHTQKAADILYSSKEREREEIATGLDWIWLTLLKIFVGYGYQTISRVCIWVMFFTAIGTVVLKLSMNNRFGTASNSITPHPIVPAWLYVCLPRRMSHLIETYLPLIVYSFNKFLPILRLQHQPTASLDLHGWVAYYFLLHQFMGFFLASLLIASFTGLVVK